MDLNGQTLGARVCRGLDRADHLSHAYIISGPAGAGKHALAMTIAQAYVCTGPGDKPCHDCPGCRKAAAGIHPDITTVSPPEGKREITVDQIRALRADAYVRPNEAARKVYVIDRAQAMNANAQNALLKLLEDGPAYAAFLLLTENPQMLLSTVRSRCETLFLVPEGEPGEREADPEICKAAQEAARLLGAEDRRGLAEFCAGLEGRKWDKDGLLALLDAIAEELHPALLERPGELLPTLEHLSRLRQAALFNVGAGHLLGWLAAGA